jgi:hypothetical protein
MAGDFSKAAELYKTALASNPGQPDLAVGLVHSLLRQQRVIEAADTVHALIGDKPATGELLTLRAEVELRQGEPWAAADTAAASAKLDSCNPRTIFVFARLAALNSRPVAAHKLLAGAHYLDPEDPEIRAAWMEGLPTAERIKETDAYLAAPRGDDADTLSDRKLDLDELKKWAAETHGPCTLVSKIAGTTIPFTAIRSTRGYDSYDAVDVKVNNHNIRLALDTSYNPRLPIGDVSGLLILKSAAEHMGLKPLFENDVPSIGPGGPRHGYVAYADSISIGDVEFHNCAVQVMEGPFWNDADGAISPSLLSDFLITLDFPAHKLILGPLPQLPQNGLPNGPIDRYIAPEMKDYTEVYRAGSDLILPVMVDGKYPSLFLMDTAMDYTMLSPMASHEFAEGRKDSKYEVRDLSGKADVRFSAGDISLMFAHVTQNVSHVASYDTARFSRDAGMEIAGFLGNQTLEMLTIHIDYRDGLVKVEFDAKHPNVFAH